MSPRLITRIGLFAALIYVLSWGTATIPNVNLVFFIVFSAGFMWGAVPGMIVGALGMGLWSAFNPYGPAMAPIMVAQMVGAALSGVVGAVFRRQNWHNRDGWLLVFFPAACGLGCTLLYYLPVNTVDAWVFQPFWPRFVAGGLWSLISVGSNLLIFPLLFRAARPLYIREKAFS